MWWLVPWRLREAARDVLDLPERLRFRRRLLRTEWRAGAGALGLAGALSGRIHGGKVKLAPLAERFGDAAAGFQVLYLVSSALPRFWDETARWALSNGARLVWNQNGVAYRAWAGAEYPRWNRPMRLGLRLASRVVYQSGFCRRSADRMLGKFEGPSDVLLNPVDLERFRPAENPARTGGALRVLAIGTHASPARVRLAIAAVGLLRRRGARAELTIAGPLDWPGAEGNAARWVAEHGLEGVVDFRGAFTQEEAPEIYRGHDLLLHCKQMDPCPTVVAEAMACGLPVVGPANGGLPEMTGTEAGILFASREDYDREPVPPAEEIAEAVAGVASDLPGYSRRARARAERLFALGRWLEAHERIFLEVGNG